MTTDIYITYFILPLLSLSLLLVFVRFVKGPKLADRVISLDMTITIGTGIIGAYSILRHQSIYLDISLILALIAFLGTIAFAYYSVQKQKKND